MSTMEPDQESVENIKEVALSVAKSNAHFKRTFSVGESLGRGGFGHVFKTENNIDKITYAIKLIFFDTCKEDVKIVRREAVTLAKLNHPNIVRYYNCWIHQGTVSRDQYDKLGISSSNSEQSSIESSNSYNENEVDEVLDEDDNLKSLFDIESYSDRSDSLVEFVPESDGIRIQILFIQMELCQKESLRTAIDNGLYQDERRIKKYFKEMCEGLSYIHSNKIIHRDLKPANIFLDANDTIKIGDFGLSKHIGIRNDWKSIPCSVSPTSNEIGWSEYTAPEVKQKKLCTLKMDIYSLGVIYFEMCSKTMTGYEKSKILPLDDTRLSKIRFPVSDSYKKKMIKNLQEPNYNTRPSCDEILKNLTSKPTTEDFKLMIQHYQKRKIPSIAMKAFNTQFDSNLQRKSIGAGKAQFLKIATQIFELHNGRDLFIPTFVPAFSDDPDNNFTTFLTSNGHSTAVSNNSRAVFCRLMAKTPMENIRRYSTERIFQEGSYEPLEDQECVFEAIRSPPDDHIDDAEILYIAKEICDKFFSEDGNHVEFVLNHRLLFNWFLRQLNLWEQRSTITRIVCDIACDRCYPTSFLHLLQHLPVVQELANLNHLMQNTPMNIKIAKNFLKNRFKTCPRTKISNKEFNVAFRILESVVEYAVEFGIDPEKISLDPLLITEENCSDLMFTVCKDNTVIAHGEHFEHLLRKHEKNKKKNRNPYSAVGISFDMSKILGIWWPKKNSTDDIYIRIMSAMSSNKKTAIPLLKMLINNGFKAEINDNAEIPEIDAIFILVEKTENVTVYYYFIRSHNFTLIFKGDWKSVEFTHLMKRRFLPQ